MDPDKLGIVMALSECFGIDADDNEVSNFLETLNNYGFEIKERDSND